MSELAIYLFGVPQVTLNRQPVNFDTRKAVALLAYLALTNQHHTRDSLAAFLWPESDESRAKSALRRTLSTLKMAVGPAHLFISRDTLGLAQDNGIFVDVHAFQEHIVASKKHDHPDKQACNFCIEEMKSAVTLYRDAFMAGFSIRGSASFDDWQMIQQENLQRDLANILERLVIALGHGGDFEPAIDYARQWLLLDPLREDAHRKLMQLYAWSGQRNAAISQYRECVRVLEEELGVRPVEETTLLYQAILEQRLEKPVAVVAKTETEKSVSSSDPAISLPMIGRQRELARIEAVYRQIGPQGSLLIVSGEAGIGKTRLATEFLSRKKKEGAASLSIHCYEGETDLAFGSLSEGLREALAKDEARVLRADIASHWLVEAMRLVPELADKVVDGPLVSSLDSPGAQSRFYEGITQTVAALCAGPVPGILFVDDGHWMDAASLDWLAYLARRLNQQALMILVTWRGLDLTVDDRLRQLLVATQRETGNQPIVLTRLDQKTTGQMVAQASPDLPAEWQERLYQETEGIPYFLVEYLAALSQSGAEWEANQSWTLPLGVRDLLLSRLNPLGDVSRQLLQAAAVIGWAIEYDLLLDASGRSEEEAITAIENLVREGILIENIIDGQSFGGRLVATYDFSHEKLRALVYEEISLARKRLLHRRVAEALSRQAVRQGQGQEPGGSAARIGGHYRLAGEEEKAAVYFKMAGDYARSLFANQEALTYYETALALGHGQTADLHEAIADLLVLIGDYEKAVNSYETAASHYEREIPGDSTSKVKSASRLERKLANVHHRRGAWEVAEGHFQMALDLLDIEDDPGQGSRLYADWSRTAHRRGQPEEALARAKQALALAETAGDEEATAQAHNILGMLARNRDELAAARDHLGQSLALTETWPDPSPRIAALNNLALVYADNDEIDPGLALLAEALELCVNLGDRHREAALHNNVADLCHAAGRKEEAMVHLKQAVSIYAEIGSGSDTWQPEIWKLTEW